MKLFVSICLALFAVPAFGAGQQNVPPATGQTGQWEAVGPTYANVYALKRDPSDPSQLIAGVLDGGIYHSKDGGHTWAIVTGEFSRMNVQTVAYDPSQQGVAYIGTLESGVYKTQDGTQSWSHQFDGLNDINVLSLAVDPFDQNFVIAACNTGIYTSHNGGAHWDPLSGEAWQAHANIVLFDPNQRGAIYIGTTAHGVVASMDEGNSWQDFSQGIGGTTVTALELNGKFLFGAATNGAFRRSTVSDTWENLTLNLGSLYILQVAPNASDPNSAFAVTYSGVFQLVSSILAPTNWVPYQTTPSRLLLSSADGQVQHLATLTKGLLGSFDGGGTWAPVNDGMQNLFIGAMAAASAYGQSWIYAGSEIGVFVGSEKGTRWQNQGTPFQTVFALAADPRAPNIVFAGTEHNGVWRSTDVGATWEQSSEGIVPPRILTISPSPFGPEVYAGAPSGLFKSGNGAGSWALATSTPMTGVLTTAFDPNRKEVLYVGDGDGHIFATFDGVNFIEIDQGLPSEAIKALRLTAISNVPAAFALTAGGKLFVTADDGSTWLLLSNALDAQVLSFDFVASNPKTIYLGTAGAGIFKTDSGGQDWQPKNNGLSSLFIDAITVDPQDSNTVFAATRGGLYKSQDGGASWIATAPLPAGTIATIFCNPRDDANLKVLVLGQGILGSRDRGNSWQASDLGLPRQDILSFAANPSYPNQLFAGTAYDGIFVSGDGGTSWVPANKSLTLFVAGIALDPQAPDTMYVSTLLGGVFKSMDAGRTYTNAGLENQALHHVEVATDAARSIYVGTGYGTALSTDGGGKWTVLGQHTNEISAMTIDPRAPNVVYIGGPNGNAFRSSDGGLVWNNLPWTLPAGTVNAIAVNSNTNSIFFAVAGYGVYRASNSLPAALVLDENRYGHSVTSLVADQLSGTVWASSYGNGVLQSTDNGATWNFRALGFSSTNVLSLVQDPSSRSVLYAGTDQGLYKTSDWGATWLKADSGMNPNYVYGITIVPGNSARLFAATDIGVFVSNDGAATWSSSGDLLSGADVRTIFVNPGNPANVYAGTKQFGVYRSVDGGASWIVSGNGLQSGNIQSILMVPPNILLAGTLGAGIERSVDGGLNWTGGLDFRAQLPVQVLAVNPANPAVIYAGTAGAGVFKSVDQGITWTAFNNGLDDLDIFSMVIDHARPATVYVGTHTQGVFVSDDDGQHWTNLSSAGMFNPFVTSLILDPSDRLTIYAGTEGGGIFRFTRPPALIRGPWHPRTKLRVR